MMEHVASQVIRPRNDDDPSVIKLLTSAASPGMPHDQRPLCLLELRARHSRAGAGPVAENGARCLRGRAWTTVGLPQNRPSNASMVGSSTVWCCLRNAMNSRTAGLFGVNSRACSATLIKRSRLRVSLTSGNRKFSTTFDELTRRHERWHVAAYAQPARVGAIRNDRD